MSALQMAKQALEEFEKAARKEQRALQPTIEVFAQRAFVSAAVAQAEALQRIAAELTQIKAALYAPPANRDAVQSIAMHIANITENLEKAKGD